MDMVRWMMLSIDLPMYFLRYALETTTYLLNKLSSKSIPEVPYKIWHGKPLSYKYLKVWGCVAHVKQLAGDKLDSRSTFCRFVGYPKESYGYYLYHTLEQKVIVSRNAAFLEKQLFSGSIDRVIELQETQEI